MEMQLKVRMIEEEALQKELDRDLEREQDAAARKVEVQRIKEEVRANRMLKEEQGPKEPTATQPVQQAPFDA